ncbi:MAG: thiamine phosphate synthase [Spirochaetes bacterium]|nr:thiamine phosphate synthase [Spirochaetota bacterium]
MNGVNDIEERESPAADRRVLAAADASLNRALEGLRVCEDVMRFSLGRADLSVRLKEARHRTAGAARVFRRGALLGARDVDADAQKFVDLEGEKRRGSLGDLFTANLHRAMEAIRSLEEFSKLVHSGPSTNPFQAIRFDLYRLEGEAFSALARSDAMMRFDRSLYAVLDPSLDGAGKPLEAAAAMVRGGAAIMELEATALRPADILAVARDLAALCTQEGVLSIVSGRPDIAILAGAGGIRPGPDDPGPRDIRAMAAPGTVIGIDASTPGEAARALEEGADFVCLGPVFGPSGAGASLIERTREITGGTIVATGGMNPECAARAVAAGADTVAARTFLFGGGSIVDACRVMAEALRRADQPGEGVRDEHR